MYYSDFNPKILEVGLRKRKARRVVSLLKANVGKVNYKKLKVLDIGCSSGVITAYLSDYFGKVVGIDIDKKALAIAREHFRGKNLNFLEMDAAKMNFVGGAFDIIVCNQTSFLIKDQKKLFGEIYRVLKDRGICFLGAMNKYSLSFQRLKHASFDVKSYGELKKLCGRFKIHDNTPKIIKEYLPFLPGAFCRWIVPFSPNFIWILEKP